MNRLLAVLTTVALFLSFAISLHATVAQFDGATQLAFDANEDIEPAAISQMRGSDEYTVVVNMKLQPDATVGVGTQLAATVVYPGGVVPVTIPTSPSYDTYADPALAKDDGAPGQPIYLAALGVKLNPDGSLDSAVLVWISTNGGLSWSAPVLADAKNTNIDHVQLDKPSIAAGLPTGPRATRMVYVAYISASSIAGGQNEVKVRSSATGSWWLSSPVLTVSGATISGYPSYNQAPTVVGDTTNGDVYVVWTRAHQGTGAPQEGIHARKASATSPQLAFTLPEGPVIATGDLFGTGQGVTLGQSGVGFVKVKAVTVPIARFDSVAKRLSITWHEAGVGGTAVRLAASTFGRPWQYDMLSSGSIDLQPSLDIDPYGNCLVTWYHFYAPAGSTLQSRFLQSATYVTFPGGLTPQHDDTLTYGFESDITAYQAEAGSGNRLLGEYHDVTFSNGTFKSSAIVINTVSGQGDPWLYILSHP